MPDESPSANSADWPDAYDIGLANQQAVHGVDESQLIAAARSVLRDAEYNSATISLAVVDDTTIHALNKRYLNHDWPTDVLSFLLNEQDGHLEGEVVLSADTAATSAAEIGWPAAAEQLLYVIHGMLHLVGHADDTPAAANEMRAAEIRHLEAFGIRLPENYSSTFSEKCAAQDASAEGIEDAFSAKLLSGGLEAQ